MQRADKRLGAIVRDCQAGTITPEVGNELCGSSLQQVIVKYGCLLVVHALCLTCAALNISNSIAFGHSGHCRTLS